jgi:chromosomal replication initiation ATPase DnaA
MNDYAYSEDRMMDGIRSYKEGHSKPVVLAELDGKILEARADLAILEEQIAAVREDLTEELRGVKVTESDLRKLASKGSRTSATIACVCAVTGVSNMQILSECRHFDINRARQMAFALLRIQGNTLERISLVFDKEQSTIRHGAQRAFERINTEPLFRQQFESIETLFSADLKRFPPQSVSASDYIARVA